jgi:hypothetical protein
MCAAQLTCSVLQHGARSVPRQVAGAEIGRTVLELLLGEARRGQITVESLHPRGVKVMGEAGGGGWFCGERATVDHAATDRVPFPHRGQGLECQQTAGIETSLGWCYGVSPLVICSFGPVLLWLGGGYGARKPMCQVSTANQNINQAAINFTRS